MPAHDGRKPTFRRPWGSAALPVALLLAWAPPAAAQAPEAAADEDSDAGRVAHVASDVLFVEESLPYLPASNTIATKLPASQERTPAHVGVVDLPLIEEQGARVLGDALANLSGLNVQTGNGVFDFFVVRGFDSLSSGLVLTDGAPEPEATFYQLYNTERVEVFKGPAGFLYGSNPLSGVVNLVRKQPVPSDFGQAALAVGSWDTFEARADVNRDLGAADLRVNALWRESDGYRDGRASEVTAINPAVRFELSEDSTLTLNLEAVGSDYQPDAGLPVFAGRVLDVPRSRSYASPFDGSAQDIVRLQADYEVALSDRVRLRNKAWYRSLDWDSRGTILAAVFPAFPGGPLLAARSLVALDDEQDFAGNQLEAVIEATVGGMEHRLLVGLELARFRDDFAVDLAPLPLISVSDPVETARPGGPIFPLSRGRTQSDVVAPYVLDSIAVSPRVQVLLGARFDSIDFEEELTGASRSDGELSPIAGVTFAATADTTLYANYSGSFAPPAPRLVGQREPEESRQLEVGVRRSWRGGRVRSTLALYQIERDNGTIPDETGVILLPGDKRSRGVEIEIGADLGDGWRTLFAYAYTDAELTRFRQQVFLDPFQLIPAQIDLSGNTVPFAPEHLASLWASKTVGRRLTLSGGARWVGEQFLSERNEARVDGYALFDAAASYAFERWRLRLRLDNLLDEEYETRGFGSSSVIPGAPFSATLGVEVRL